MKDLWSRSDGSGRSWLMLSKNMRLINNSHVVELTLDLVQGEPLVVSSRIRLWNEEVEKKKSTLHVLWQLIYPSPTEIGANLINGRHFLVVGGYMLTTCVPGMYRSGKPLPWVLFDVRIPHREELTACHVVLVNNVSSCSEMLWYFPWTQKSQWKCISFYKQFNFKTIMTWNTYCKW